ncbi:MAG: trypsin-like peptidase domain-containing protein [bacterium]|nr:trypsin-like peptidase domain-containing protein [bacterium]
MKNFTQKQIIILIVGVALVASVVTSFSTVVFLLGETPAKIIEKLQGSNIPSQQIINKKILSQDELVVGVVKAASPGVVSIVASKDVPVIEQYYVNPFSNDQFFQQFFGDQLQVPQYRQKGTKKQDVSSGSGFVVSSDGLVLTNKHVVEDTEAEYTVFLNDGTKLSAKVLARDPFQDLAILKITPPASGLTPLILGDSDGIQTGQTVIAIGNALGEFKNTVSVGIVSGLQRSLVAQSGTGSESLQELIQTDAAINPGNSGGPLLNLMGEVIGINIAMANGAQSIGFALGINKAKLDVDSVKTSGRIVYPFIGVRYVVVNKDVQDKNKLAFGYGVLVAKSSDGPAVIKDSPADKAGIKENDVILSINDQKIDLEHTLSSYILKYRVGDKIILAVLRDGKQVAVPVTLEERKPTLK